MSENTSETTTATATPEGDIEAKVYEKGTWQHDLQQSTSLKERGAKAVKRAGALLWTGAQQAIEDWLPESSTDVGGEALYGEVLEALGKPRKGDASKIKTVAVAVKDHGMVLSVWPSLTKAYGEARRLTQTIAQQADEDDAAEKAIEALAESVPNTTGTVEGAALLLLSKGVDGAVVAILDALGAKNEAAHRSFMRAVSTEISARVQANKPQPAPKAPAANKGAAKPSTGKAAVKSSGAKAKPGTKAKPGSKAKPVPVSASKGDPNAKALPPKAQPVAQANKGEAVSEPVEAGTETVSTPAVPVKQAATKAKPPVVVQR